MISHSNIPCAAPVGLLLLAALAFGCGQHPPQGGSDVALRLGEDEVPYRRFERYLERNLGTGDTSADVPAPAVLSRLFDRFVDEELLVRMAVSAGFDESALAADDQRPSITFLLERALGREDVTPQAIGAFYEQNIKNYDRPEQAHVWQILVARRALAEEALRTISDGESFQAAVRRLEGDPDADFCGDQGFLTYEDLPPSLADTIFALAPGETSDVLETDFGFYLFWVEERTPAATRSLESVTIEIRDNLLRGRLIELEAELIREARARYNVRVFAANLPFDYRGSYAANG
jgi:hypothetical protein